MHSRPGAQISLTVDASDSHVGSVLQQLLEGSWAPLAFFSKNLSIAEQKYSAFDRELLAAYSSLRHFCFLLEGRAFRIFTDLKPLTLAFFRISPPWSAPQQQHLAYLTEFTSPIEHVPGIKNVVANALSLPSPVPESVHTPVSGSTASSLVYLPSSTVPPPVFSDPALSSLDFRLFSALQLTCPSVSKIDFFSVPQHSLSSLWRGLLAL